MTVLFSLTDERLRRVGWRLVEGRRFSTSLPEGELSLPRSGDLCLVLVDRPTTWDGETLVPDEDAPAVRSIIALSRIRGSTRPTTTDDRVVLSDHFVLDDPIPLRALSRRIPRDTSRAINLTAPTAARAFIGALGDAIVTALLGLRPDLASTVARLRRAEPPLHGPIADTLVLERDAVRVALAIAGADPHALNDWGGVGQNGFLASLQYETPEDVLVGYDAARFPDWEALPGERPDWTIFSDGHSHLRVGNVNRTPLERTLGVDLIYRHIEADTTVLVQYKRMRKDARGSLFYRPDAQFHREMVRMRRVEQHSSSDTDARTWRLYPRGCLLKLVSPPREFDPFSDRLLPGLYLPIAYVDELLAHDSTLTPKGSRRLGYETVSRYLTNQLFVALVRQGWIGTRGVTQRAVASLIDAALRDGHSVMLAEESGAELGPERRQRPAAS